MPSILYVFTSCLSVGFCQGHGPRLKEEGIDLAVVSSPGKELEQLQEEDGTRVFAVPMAREISPGADLVSLYRLWRLIRRTQPEITNVQTPKAGLLGGIAAILAGVPERIYTLQGLRLETTKGLKRWVLTQAERVACACATDVICVSPSLRRRALDLQLVSPNKAVVLGRGSFNGVDFQRYSGPTNDFAAALSLRQKLGIPQHAPVVGFVGRLTRDKGLAELVKAYGVLKQRHPDLHLLLLGDFEDGDPVPATVRRRINEDPDIIAPGYVPGAAPYYPLMNVLALPTYREGLPTVALEAAAAGKPVVTTNATGAVDAVLNRRTGIIVPVGDADALREALETLLTNPKLRTQMGLAGQEWVRREFRHEIVLDRLVDRYKELLLLSPESETVPAEAQETWARSRREEAVRVRVGAPQG